MITKMNNENLHIPQTHISQVTPTYYAFAKGYYDGLAKGVEKNPYKPDLLRYFYRCGYDAGVTEYCDITHPEE